MVKIHVQHSLKRPDAEPYSSRQHSVAMEVDVPEDAVAKGKEGIREFVARVTAEVRSYVEEALADIRVEQQEREPESAAPTPPSSRAVPNGALSPRPGPNGGAPRRPHATAAVRAVGNGHENGRSNGASREGGVGASFKQIQFARSLGARAGYSVSQLSALCEESFGRQLEEISKSDASALIEQLRGEVQR